MFYKFNPFVINFFIKIFTNKKDRLNVVSLGLIDKEVVELLNGLKDREQKVITLRFGLNGEEKQTLEEIGRIYGVTKECIRQTEARALNKLRNNVHTLSLYSDYLN